MTKVLYPGSFDPLTKGHMDIIEQATRLFDEVIVAVLVNPAKTNYMFSYEERVKLIKEVYKANQRIKVIHSKGVAVDVALLNDCKAIIRGIRDVTDVADEMKLARINKNLSKDQIITLPLYSSVQLIDVSSSLVKEIFGYDKEISEYVDPVIEKAMIEKRNAILKKAR